MTLPKHFPQQQERSFNGSSLSTIEIGDDGRIVNWPAGFMDVTVQESQRLLDAMYGNLAIDGGMSEEHDD